MDTSNIFVTGYKGMIGSRLIERGCSPLDVDVRDIVAVDKQIKKNKPKLIFHLAAKSSVNFCEEEEKLSEDTNWHGSNNVFAMAEKHNVPVVFISSDHVFSGNWWGNYREDSQDLKPRNKYGWLKWATEASALAFDNVNIIRTSVLFYRSRSMVATYLSSIEGGEEVRPPAFLWRSFMHANHFTESLIHYADSISKMPKILHISGSKVVSWYRFIYDYATALDLDTSLIKARYTDIRMPGEADRPKRAGLDTQASQKLGFIPYSYLDGIKESL